MLDIQSGNAILIDAPNGVYGFAQLPDGQVLAYGGTMHLGHRTGSIARVDRGTWESLGSYALGDRIGEENKPVAPRYPITHVIVMPELQGLVVFAFRDVFYVNYDLKEWRHLGTVDLHYEPGRPDAMGPYPAVRSIHLAQDGSTAMLVTTVRDGLLRVEFTTE
jgi:hypothetical protein